MGHPLRVRILELVSKKGATFITLKEETGASVGSIYHHLSKLKGYVERDKRGRYYITEKGIKLLSRIGEGKPRAAKAPALTEYLLFAKITKAVMGSKLYCLTALLISSAFVSLSAFFAGYAFILFSFVEYERVKAALLSPASSLLSVFLLAKAISYIYGARGWIGDLELAGGVALSIVPSGCFLLLFAIMGRFELMFMFQFFSIALLATTLNLSKGIKLSHSLLLGLLISYVSLAILLITY